MTFAIMSIATPCTYKSVIIPFDFRQVFEAIIITGEVFIELVLACSIEYCSPNHGAKLVKIF